MSNFKINNVEGNNVYNTQPHISTLQNLCIQESTKIYENNSFIKLDANLLESFDLYEDGWVLTDDEGYLMIDVHIHYERDIKNSLPIRTKTILQMGENIYEHTMDTHTTKQLYFKWCNI